jgi:hypothetical protein
LSSVIVAGNVSGSVTLDAPAVSGSTVITLPTTTGTMMVNGPAVSAYLNSAQSLSSQTHTKVTLDVENFDTNSNFASSRFTPTVAGYYQVNGSVMFGSTTSTQFGWAEIYKNGSAYQTGNQVFAASISYPVSNVSTLVYCNGSTDYIELYAWFSAAINLNQGLQNIQFSASMVRSA